MQKDVMAVRYSARGLGSKKKKEKKDDLPDAGISGTNPWRTAGLVALALFVAGGAYVANEQLKVPPPTFAPALMSLSSNALPCSKLEVSGTVLVCRIPRATVQSKSEVTLKALGAATAKEAGERGFMRVIVLAEEDGAMLVAFDALK